MKNIFRIIATSLLSVVLCASCEDNIPEENKTNQEPAVPLQANVTGNEGGYDYVDLGLPSGIMWATYNIGASTPNEYGEYYAYGEIETKERYSFDNYQEPEYNCYGTADMLPEYDVARNKWGGKWRIPSVDEFSELTSYCRSSWGLCNGEYGCYYTGPNGNSLFFSATGYMYEDINRMEGTNATYQTTTKNYSIKYEARFNQDYSNFTSVYLDIDVPNTNYLGKSVRPVMYLSEPKAGKQVVSGTQDGYDYVDLGLSVMWATCNVGADKPEEYGNYYAWGETEEKDTYTKDNYKWSYELENNMLPSILSLENDVAYKKWGAAWRMPSLDEYAELYTCEWYWENRGGVKGYKIVGPNGNSIFLPAAGSNDNLGKNDINYNLHYYVVDGYISNNWNKSYSSMNSMNMNIYGGYEGYSVRPVLREKTTITLIMDYCEVNGNTPAIKLNNKKLIAMQKNAGGEWEVSFLANPSDEFVFVSTSSNYGSYIEKYDEYEGWQKMQEVYTIGTTKHYVYDFSDASKYRWRECGIQQNDNVELVNGYECVDLGLSVKWATCNIEATTAEELGSRFVWASTVPNKNKIPYRSELYNENYGYAYSKYWVNTKFGTIDYKTVLEPVDDAAASIMGGTWRMPTKKEFEELLEKCTWQMVVQNGRFGYKVTGVNNNSIFFPCDFISYNAYNQMGYTYYWTSSLNTDSDYSSMSAFIVSLSKQCHAITSHSRNDNNTLIRAVVPKK